MKKTHIAFQMSTERLADRGRLYFWTFTFAEKLDIKETRKRWNHLLTLMRRQWPNLCGLRVFELHKSHGLHVHLLTDRFIDVNAARIMAKRAGWGRIHVQRMRKSEAGYLGKYLSKDRPPCFKGWRLWAAFGCDWDWTKVSNLQKNSAFSRVYRYFKEVFDWHGNQGFFNRMEKVSGALQWEITSSASARSRTNQSDLQKAIYEGGSVVIL